MTDFFELPIGDVYRSEIDELSKLHTTQEIVRKYRKTHGRRYLDKLIADIEHCSIGNRLAIEACIGSEWRMYARSPIERPIDENKDIIGEMRGE